MAMAPGSCVQFFRVSVRVVKLSNCTLINFMELYIHLLAMDIGLVHSSVAPTAGW